MNTPTTKNLLGGKKGQHHRGGRSTERGLAISQFLIDGLTNLQAMIYPLYDNLKPFYLRILYGHPVDRKKRLLISLFTVVSSDWTRVKTSFWFQMMWNFLSKTHVVPSGLLESLRMINMKNFRTVKNSVDAYLPPKYLQTIK